MRDKCIMYAYQGSLKGLPYFLGAAPDRYMNQPSLLFQPGVGIFLSELGIMLKTMEERFY